jgi:predicted component of type VI protein secretion system
MDTQESQASVRSEIQKLTSEIRTTNAIIQLRQFEANPTSDDDFTLEEMSETRRNIEAWRQSAESLAAAVTSYEPDLQSVAERAEDAAFCREIGLGIRDDVSDNELHDRFERLDSTPSINGPEASMSHSDSGVEVDEVDETASDWDPEPEKEYHLSVDIIECQIAANKDNVTKLLNDGLYFQAEQYQKKRIGLQDQLLKTHKVPFHDRADAEELLAKIQGKQKTKDSLRRAKDTIQRLLAQEVERLQLEPHEDRSRLYRLYHKLGETYLELVSIASML